MSDAERARIAAAAAALDLAIPPECLPGVVESWAALRAHCERVREAAPASEGS